MRTRNPTKKQKVLAILERLREKDPVFDAFYELISMLEGDAGWEVIEYLDMIIDRFLAKCGQTAVEGHLADLATTRTHLETLLSREDEERRTEQDTVRASTPIL